MGPRSRACQRVRASAGGGLDEGGIIMGTRAQHTHA
jgi:hypothetical protein